MKKLAAVCCFLILLTGCSQEPKELKRGMTLRTCLLQAESCTFSVEITADYGDRLQSFAMDCQVDPKGDLSFSVTAPESITGITGKIDDTGGKLTFEETALYFGLLADEQLSPVAAPWVLMKALRSGYLRAAGMEGECLRLTIDDSYQDDAMTLDIWLNSQDLPQSAEVLYDGKRILSMIVKDVVIL